MKYMPTRFTLIALVVLACGGASAQCTPEWARDMFPLQSLNGAVHALCVYNGELYAGGRFTSAGGATADHIARWNGTSWQAVGAGMNFDVYALCVYSGELYAGGAFTTAGGAPANAIARWNGTAWQAVGGSVGNSVYALCVHNGELYAGGFFTTAGGAPANRIAKWNGASWQAVGAGMDNVVYALSVHGGELHAGGWFTTAGGAPANHIARWDGVSWQALGTGTSDSVFALCPFNGELYAGGWFTTAGGATARYIARWNGTSWQAVGTGMDYYVYALSVHDGALYAGGYFTAAGGVTANKIASWNGASWQALGSGMDSWVYALCEYNDGLGPAPALYAGGRFTTAGGSPSTYIARWGCETAITDAAEAKPVPDGRLVSITEDVSTAVFGGAFYVSQVSGGSQVSGIRAEMPGHSVTMDKLTSVTGRTRTTAGGERYISAWSAVSGAAASARPVSMSLKSVGGGPSDPAGLSGQQGITGAYGLNNIGMLVRAFGRFTYIDDHNFTLDDGSGLPVHCVTPQAVTVSPLWQYVAATGASSCERNGAELHRRLLVRSAADIQVFLP